ncbi:hypothetical protein C448_09757 [Halococcus morrhuae DSM 1307]|uniref:Uncharacterized protein n=1 Tax=Halococcus morrhuae DSM 1307 TaxID=931277 RepID=M0MGC6_HALMO|nr:hypothetical protein C448_09757 [Halococcus morrhuae DSM 1307]
MPLVHQIDRRRDDERPDTSIGDGLDAEKRLPAPSWKDNAATSVMTAPCIECCLLVLAWLDLECGIECKLWIGSGDILDRGSRRLDGPLVV